MARKKAVFDDFIEEVPDKAENKKVESSKVNNNTSENTEDVAGNKGNECCSCPRPNILFEKVKSATPEVKLPQRSTSGSAGYDFFSPVSITTRPGDIGIIKTGIKACMGNLNMFLMIVPRSSMGIKNKVALANNVGIIDSDYYNNEDNEGEICIALYNFGTVTHTVSVGDKIAQGIFVPYFEVNNDTADGKRTGGIGSTGK